MATLLGLIVAIALALLIAHNYRTRLRIILGHRYPVQQKREPDIARFAEGQAASEVKD